MAVVCYSLEVRHIKRKLEKRNSKMFNYNMSYNY